MWYRFARTGSPCASRRAVPERRICAHHLHVFPASLVWRCYGGSGTEPAANFAQFCGGWEVLACVARR
eukprot:5286962-Lingulodinium_polyedra.AAC.1